MYSKLPYDTSVMDGPDVTWRSLDDDDGRPHARRRKLDEQQELVVFDAIVNSHPTDPDRMFWEREEIGRLIQGLTGMEMAQRTLTSYLMRWGMVPEKPLKSAYRLAPDDVKHWMRNTYPTIAFHAKVERAEIRWLGLARLHPPKGTGDTTTDGGSDPSAGPGMVFLISNRRHVSWLCHQQADLADRMVELLNGVVASAHRKLCIIAPNDLDAYSLAVLDHWALEHQHCVQLHRMGRG